MSAQKDAIEEVQRSMELAEEERRKNRLQHGLIRFLEGRIEILNSSEFIPGFIFHLTEEPWVSDEEKHKLLKQLGRSSVVEEPEIRTRAHIILSSVAQFFLLEGRQDYIQLLQEVFCDWLEAEEEMISSYPVMTKRLEELFEWFIGDGSMVPALQVLNSLNGIKKGINPKGKTIRSTAGKCLDNLGSRKTVNQLTENYLRRDSSQGAYQQMLLALGEKAVTYLLNRLFHSYSKSERLLILDLIPQFQEDAMVPIQECLQTEPPWIVIRNVVFLIAEIGNGKNFALVQDYLGHSDERVQHEMVSCILKIGG